MGLCHIIHKYHPLSCSSSKIGEARVRQMRLDRMHLSWMRSMGGSSTHVGQCKNVPKVDTCRAQSTCELITPRPATSIDKGYTESGIFCNILHSKKQPGSSKQMQHHLHASRQTPKIHSTWGCRNSCKWFYDQSCKGQFQVMK